MRRNGIGPIGLYACGAAAGLVLGLAAGMSNGPPKAPTPIQASGSRPAFHPGILVPTRSADWPYDRPRLVRYKDAPIDDRPVPAPPVGGERRQYALPVGSVKTGGKR